MTWVLFVVLIAGPLAVVRSLWLAGGPPWAWPGALLAAVRRRRRPDPLAGLPDPFEMLWLQHRLASIAGEIRLLEVSEHDHVFARAHRIHTRRVAYDQLLAEACRLAGIADVAAPAGDATRAALQPDAERFEVEMELAARGWHW